MHVLASLGDKCSQPSIHIQSKLNSNMQTQATADELHAKGINPRTKEPYVRGGAYNKDKSVSAAGNIAQHVKKEAAEKKVKDEVSSLRSELQREKAEVARLTEALKVAQNETKAAQESTELQVKAATLEASQKAAEQMLQRYRDGLRDGAALSSGSIRLSASTPDSACAYGASPASFSAAAL